MINIQFIRVQKHIQISFNTFKNIFSHFNLILLSYKSLIYHRLRTTLFHLRYNKQIIILFQFFQFYMKTFLLFYLLFYILFIFYHLVTPFGFSFAGFSSLFFLSNLLIGNLTFFCQSVFQLNIFFALIVVLLCIYQNHFKFLQINGLFLYSLKDPIIPFKQYFLNVFFLLFLKLNQTLRHIQQISNRLPSIIRLVITFPLNQIISMSSHNLHIDNFVTLIVSFTTKGRKSIVRNVVTLFFCTFHNRTSFFLTHTANIWNQLIITINIKDNKIMQLKVLICSIQNKSIIIIIFIRQKVMLVNKFLKHCFSSIFQTIPTINLENCLQGTYNFQTCLAVSKAFHQYGCLLIKDPRVDEQKNTTFLNLMKKYFKIRQKQIQNGELVDVYKEQCYQIGLSPPNVITLEDFIDPSLKNKITQYQTAPKAKSLPVLRYLWNIGKVSSSIPSNIPPKDVPQFQTIMDDWGNRTFNTALTVTEMLQIGLGLKKGTVSSKLIGGANKLAPNGISLQNRQLGQSFVNIHDDINFITVHGRSSFPGLSVWFPSGQKFNVRTPPGHLFLQSGSQLQYLTGGYIKSGLHEVTYTPEAQNLAQKQIRQGKDPWRISSTMFTHLHSDTVLQPEKKFLNSETQKRYPPIRQHQFMMKYVKQRQI